jgi:hypothetical protein
MSPRGQTCQPTSKSARPNAGASSDGELRAWFFVARGFVWVVNHAPAHDDFLHDDRPALDHLLAFRLTSTISHRAPFRRRGVGKGPRRPLDRNLSVIRLHVLGRTLDSRQRLFVEVFAVDAHDALVTVDLRRANGRQCSAMTSLDVDVEHHDLTLLGIDQQVSYFTNDATAQRSNLPAADVWLALSDIPVIELLERRE